MQKCQILPHIPSMGRDKLSSVMKMKEKKNSSVPSKEAHKQPDPASLAKEFRMTRDDGIRSDVLGSYTGVTREGDTPIQDADDL